MNLRPRYSAGTTLMLVLIGCATGPTHAHEAMKGQPIGVPLAHWSEDFSFGIRFSAPVAAIAREALHPPEAILDATPTMPKARGGGSGSGRHGPPMHGSGWA